MEPRTARANVACAKLAAYTAHSKAALLQRPAGKYANAKGVIMPTPITNGLKDIILAGIGAMAITGEKASEVVDKLIARGELTVDQGKEINKELQHKAEGALEKARVDALEAAMAAMTPEERAAFAAKAAEIAAKPDAEEAAVEAVEDSEPTASEDEQA